MPVPDKDEMMALVKDNLEKLSAPIDYEALERDGVIKKEGAWYRILDMDRLPEHARARANVLEIDSNGGARVRFAKRAKGKLI